MPSIIKVSVGKVISAARLFIIFCNSRTPYLQPDEGFHFENGLKNECPERSVWDPPKHSFGALLLLSIWRVRFNGKPSELNVIIRNGFWGKVAVKNFINEKP